MPQVVDQLWREPNREMQYAAMELLFGREKELTLADLPLLERMVTTGGVASRTAAVSLGSSRVRLR